MIKLVIALGNPGLEYELTRHNIGWLVVDGVDFGYSSWKKKFKGEYNDISHAGEKLYFLKPLTFMNLSGESARPLMDFFKIKVDEVLVVHDELDVEFGQIQFKKGGGLAGHNGLKSLNQCLGSADFYRLRIGIGRPDRGSVSSWVLSQFPKEKDHELSQILDESKKALMYFLDNGIRDASAKYNKKNLI